MATSAKSHGSADCRTAVSRAPGLQGGEPQCRRLGGHRRAADELGGECSSRLSRTRPGKTRLRPEGLNRRISCIHRMVQLQVRPLGVQLVQAAFRAPGEVAAQI